MSGLRHLFIDSRFRTSGTDSDFTINLTENITLPLGARCYLASVSFSNVFYTIEEGVNDRLYCAIRHGDVIGGYAFPLFQGNYGGEQLALEFGSKIKHVDSGSQVAYIKSQGRLQIVMSSAYQINIVSDEELSSPTFRTLRQTYAPTAEYNIDDPRSVNEVLKTQLRGFDTAVITELTQLQPFHTTYLHSNLTTYDSMDSVGRRSIIARIPVMVQFGYVNHWEGSMDALWFDVSEMTFRNLSCSLQTARGTPLDLHGTHLSLPLVFD